MLLRKTQIHFFFLTASSAQMAQTEEFMFQNVAYRPTVYRTGEAPEGQAMTIINIVASVIRTPIESRKIAAMPLILNF